MFNGRTKLNICRVTIIIIFVAIVLTDLIILSIDVHNELPTITDAYQEMDEFPAPYVGFQLRNNFTITCIFLIYHFYDCKIILSYATQGPGIYKKLRSEFACLVDGPK